MHQYYCLVRCQNFTNGIIGYYTNICDLWQQLQRSCTVYMFSHLLHAISSYRERVITSTISNSNLVTKYWHHSYPPVVTQHWPLFLSLVSSTDCGLAQADIEH